MAEIRTQSSLTEVIGASFKARPVAFDPFFYDRGFQGAHTDLAQGSTEKAASQISTRPEGWLLATTLVSADSKIPAETFKQWSELEPSGTTYALYGGSLIRDAWAIRGKVPSEQVPREAWTLFRDGLKAAEAVLWQGVEQFSESADSWVGLMTTARGLELGPAEIHKRFSEAHKLAPFRGDVCNAMLQGVCEKWGASHDEMFNFARWVERNAPADSAAHSVVPLAHFERVVAGRDEGLKPSSYFVEPEVASELMAVAANYLEATPREAHPAHLEMLNHLVLVLQPHDEASAQFLQECAHRLGDRPTALPWMYYGGNIGRRFATVRAERIGEAHLYEETQLS